VAQREAEFRAFVDAHGASLLHAARLLTGDHHRGEDLLQSTLIKLYLRWPRVDEPMAYARKALVTGQIDVARRRWFGERPVEAVPESGTPADVGAVDQRDELRRMLATLTPRERALIVLRYYCDLSEQQAAAELGLPLGTVKSSTARALTKLRVSAHSEAR